jgi:hypothetical protein
MQPFPVVRIAGIETRSGAKLRLLKVQQTPAGALLGDTMAHGFDKP